MARPKKEDSGKARQSIIETFWNCLAENPYSHLSIRMLSNKAGVNHNTFYKYFENIDDLAEKAFYENLFPAIPQVLFQFFEEDRVVDFSFIDSDNMWIHIQRTLLFIKSDSAYLAGIVQNAMRTIWLEQLDIDESELTVEDMLELNFVFGGFVAALRTADFQPSPHVVREIWEKPFFKGALQSLTELKNRHHI